MRRGIVMADAGFEAVLGTVLVMGWTFGQIDEDDFADPVVGAVSAIFGLALIGLAVVLAELVKRETLGDRVLTVLAGGNIAFAGLLAIWVLLADGFTSGGRGIVWVTIVALLLLGTVQAGLATRR